MKGGGGSAPAPTEQKVTTTDLPEYVQPYFERLLKRGEAETLQPQAQYGGQRLAYFSPDELTAQAMTRGYAMSGSPQELNLASQRLQSLPTGIDSSYTAGQLGQPGYSAGQFDSGYQAGQVGPTYQAGQLGSQFQASSFDPGYQARDIGPTYQAERLGSSYQAGSFDPGYQASVRTSGYQAGLSSLPQYQKMGFEEGVSRFMSPYQQAVTDIEKREARRQSEISGQQIESQAAQTGGLGGYREAILQAERERNLGQQLGDIQARGSQQAYEQAVRQVGAERAADLQAAQFGLSTFGQAEQAAQQQERLAQQAFQAGEQARQQAARMGLSAQQAEDASRQAQERFSQSAFQAQQQALQSQGAQGIQAFQAGEAARQKAAQLGLTAQQQEDASRQAQERFLQSGFQAQQQALQAQGAQGIQAFQAGEAAKQQAARLGLTAQQQEDAARQAEERFRQAGFQADEAARQQQERLGQSAFDLSSRYGLAAAQQLAGLGQQRQADTMARIQALQQQGAQQRALQQAGMDLGYQDFLRQQDYAQRQLGLYSQLLRGVPIQPQQTVSTFQQQPGLFQSLVGLGLGGLGMYRGMGG
jgi:hypothetical protein